MTARQATHAKYAKGSIQKIDAHDRKRWCYGSGDTIGDNHDAVDGDDDDVEEDDEDYGDAIIDIMVVM